MAARKARTGVTGAEPPGKAATRAQGLGPRIRQMRQAANWTLSELSARSDIAVSTLSKVENGVLTLTYDRLLLIAQAFDLSLSEFLSGVGTNELRALPTARLSLARKGSGTAVDTANYDYLYLCENLRSKMMVPILSRCRARSLEEFGPLLRHAGEEFIFVVKGRITVCTEHYEPTTLDVGEGVYIDSRMGHAYLQASEDEALILSVNAGS